jgi:hypothetical protein
MRVFAACVCKISTHFNENFYDQLYIEFRVTVSEPLALYALLAMNDIARLNGIVNNLMAMNYLVTL